MLKRSWMNKQNLKKLNKEELDRIIHDPEAYLMTDEGLKSLKVMIVEEQERLRSICLENKQAHLALQGKQKELLELQNNLSEIYTEYQQRWIEYSEIRELNSLEPKRKKLSILVNESQKQCDEIANKSYYDDFLLDYKEARIKYYQRHFKLGNLQ
eukprot:NODE_266_length_12318_cov_0.301498.p5 type:complete len:155 gc:universal NODE_266_length_12318_cov_0.301498:155-619(+)